MDNIKRRILLSALKALNLALMAVSFGAATVLLFADGKAGVDFSDFLSMRISLRNLGVSVLILWAWHLIFSMFDLYQSRRLASLPSLVADTAKATTVACLCFAAMAKILAISMATPGFIILSWAFSTVLLITARVEIWQLLRAIRRQGRNLRHILIVGTNSRARAFADHLSSKSSLGYHILGFVDDDWKGLSQFTDSGHKLACDFASLAAFLRRNVVDEVAVYLPVKSFYSHTSHVVSLCEQHGIAVRFDPDLFDLKIARFQAVDMEGRIHIAARMCCPDGWPGLVKRTLDIMVSSGLLLLLAPVFALAAMLIRLTSKGPTFFLQERVGFNKRRFHIYKFRTMVVDAEKMLPALEKLNEVSGPVFKIKKDPRITPIGGLLRRSSIDELPQLLNVLKGDMSLVGPRPLPVRDYEGFSEDWQRRRFSVRPGITCLWQVNGRSSISFDQWMKLDLQYMDEWSLWLDLKILARTVPAVLKGSGAA